VKATELGQGRNARTGCAEAKEELQKKPKTFSSRTIWTAVEGGRRGQSGTQQPGGAEVQKKFQKHCERKSSGEKRRTKSGWMGVGQVWEKPGPQPRQLLYFGPVNVSPSRGR